MSSFTNAQIEKLKAIAGELIQKLFGRGATLLFNTEAITYASIPNIEKTVKWIEANSLPKRDDYEEDELGDWRGQYSARSAVKDYRAFTHFYNVVVEDVRDMHIGPKMEEINLWYINRLRTDILGYEAL